MPPIATQSVRRNEASRCANSDLTRRSKPRRYSITSSARASSRAGTVEAKHHRGLEFDITKSEFMDWMAPTFT